MIEINITYEGQLHCKAVHGPSGAVLETDAPVDNHGKGESFSPTDLAATSLGVCLLTVMGISANDRKVNMEGTTCRIEKHMSTDTPRRIVKIIADINFPTGISLDKRGLLDAVALHCPVAKSLNHDMEVKMNFNFPD
jgi:putative redox protein